VTSRKKEAFVENKTFSGTRNKPTNQPTNKKEARKDTNTNTNTNIHVIVVVHKRATMTMTIARIAPLVWTRRGLLGTVAIATASGALVLRSQLLSPSKAITATTTTTTTAAGSTRTLQTTTPVVVPTQPAIRIPLGLGQRPGRICARQKPRPEADAGCGRRLTEVRWQRGSPPAPSKEVRLVLRLVEQRRKQRPEKRTRTKPAGTAKPTGPKRQWERQQRRQWRQQQQ